MTDAATLPSDNPFAAPSRLDHEAPDFARLRFEHFRPALLAGLEQRAEQARAIASASSEPTFENTIEALECSGALFARADAVFGALCAAHVDEALQALQAQVAPLATAAEDEIWLDAQLFARVETVYADRESLADLERRRLVERYHTEFVRRGVRLEPDAQTRLRAINAELSTLSTTFEERLLADTNASAVLFEDEAQLAGLSAGTISAAREAAVDAGHANGWLLGIELPTSQGAVSQLTDRDARRRVFEAAIGRCSKAGTHDTSELVRTMTALRAERARLLGFDNHASYVLADEMAGTPRAVREMIGGLIPRIVARCEEEERNLRAHFARELPDAELEPWDWTFTAERVRAERFGLDDAVVRAYFPIWRVLTEGVFFMARELYGLELKERPDLPVYHPDVRVWEVFDADGQVIGLFYGDFFARSSKRRGAWMTSFVEQSELLNKLPVVCNVMSVPKPSDGEALLTFDQVTTMFHEFGHALHGLLSSVRHPRLSGTSVPRDFVEFASQLHEDFAFEPRVLERCARHHETGAPLPEALIEKIRASRRFGQGFDALEYTAAALLDLELHSLDEGEAVDDVAAFEHAALERCGLAHPLIPPRYRANYFAHIFAGGYSAGYYAYLWSEALAADGFAGMLEAGGLCRTAGDRARATFLSRGFADEPMAMFRAFRGRELDTGPLLERRGLA